jgi:hypothetical protein
MTEGKEGAAPLAGRGNQEDGGADQHHEQVEACPHQVQVLEEASGWAMEVYKGAAEGQEHGNEDCEEGILEFDLDEEGTQEASRLLAIASFFSRKSFSLNYLFSDMLKAWNMKQLAAVEKIGDCWNRPSALLPINRRRRTPARRSRSNGIGELVCTANDLAVFSIFSPFYYAKSTSKHAYN